jgi:tripeptide aminopeptidase
LAVLVSGFRKVPVNKIAQLAHAPQLQALHAVLPDAVKRLIEEAITIQQIPAPTFDEARRAAYVSERFKALDLKDITIDALHNVYGRLPGLDHDLPAVLVAAHTDTVFDAGTSLDVQRQNGKIIGPGLGDNSLGVAAVLALADLVRGNPLRADVWFVANTREEGMGDLGGIRAVYEKLGPHLGAALIVEGMAYGRVYHSGIAVRRLEITCRTPGGHSWLHYGRPSAIHALMRLGADITTLDVPQSPRTTYNIGVIKGGHSVNSIATTASLLLDLRSEDRLTLEGIERQVIAMVDKQRGTELEFEVTVVGDRPSGAIAATHPLVQLARDVLQHLGTPPIFETGSTDANVLLAAGLPTITIGITHGGNAHRLDEYIETAAIKDGLWQLMLLLVGAVDGLARQDWLPIR